MTVLVSFADKRDIPLGGDICGEVVYFGGVVALEYSLSLVTRFRLVRASWRTSSLFFFPL